jgi:DNA-binding transcriptional MerR regulator
MQSRDPLWTLDELSAEVALALAVDYAGPVNGRIREVPDARTIRYYTTLGLLDRPAEFRGRTALYGPRHLLQLVAVKRLQARGLSLTEIQSRLAGLTDSALRELARPAPSCYPAGRETAPTPRGAGQAGDRRATAFWGETPAAPPPADAPRPAAPLVGLPLAEGVTLLLDASRSPDNHDLEALRVAAAPLLKLLKARRLLGPDKPTDEG